MSSYLLWVSDLSRGRFIRLPHLGQSWTFSSVPCILLTFRTPKFKFTWYTNALKVKASFGSLLSSLCSLVFDLSILHFLATLPSILGCFFSRNFAQGTWSIILKEIQISPSHHSQVLLKNRWHSVFFFFLILSFSFFLSYFWLCWVFVAAYGLSLVVASGGYSFVAVHGLPIVVASLVAKHGL